VAVGAGTVVAEPGEVVVTAAVVGGCTAGSAFSPHPVAATAAAAAVPSTSGRSRLPAKPWKFTAGTVTKRA
jgi:hypothetical protein